MTTFLNKAFSLITSLPFPHALPQSLHFTNTRLAVSALTTTLLALTLPRIYRNYRTFISYGPGGVPYNLLGWFAATVILSPWAAETLSTEVYARKIAAGDTASYLDDEVVKARKRDRRPEIGPHVAPQRQVDEFPKKEIKEVSISYYSILA
jgi:hypothetical protein